jgi:lipoprotein-releasing system permease protein
MHDYDANVAVARTATARAALGLGVDAVTGIGLIIADPDNPADVVRGIIAEIPRAQVRTWQQMNRNLFEALKLEKIMMFIILTLIIIVAAFNIVSNLSLFVTQKSREIGVLKSLGMSSGSVSRVFILIGAMLGALGTFAGSVVGISVCVVLRKYDIIRLPSDVYFISRLPVRIVVSDILWTVLVSIIITVLATLLPSRKAGAMNTAEIFRYG